MPLARSAGGARFRQSVGSLRVAASELGKIGWVVFNILRPPLAGAVFLILRVAAFYSGLHGPMQLGAPCVVSWPYRSACWSSFESGASRGTSRSIFRHRGIWGVSKQILLLQPPSNMQRTRRGEQIEGEGIESGRQGALTRCC